MAEEWRKEFERRALAACGIGAEATFNGIEAGSESWSHSTYTCGTDSWVEVRWIDQNGRGGSRRFYEIGELIRLMDGVE